MKKIFIFDDNKEHLYAIKNKIEKYKNNKFDITCYSDSNELVDNISKGTLPDILFMDIVDGNSKDTGIDIIKKFLKDSTVEIIYVSGLVKYCMDVYETNHTYFLTKPIDDNQLFKALDKALYNIKNNEESANLMIKTKNEVANIATNKILYIESDKRKVNIVLTERVVTIYSSLSKLINQLPNNFIFCHKSFLVNLKWVVSMKNDKFVLCNNIEIPISQSKRNISRQAFFNYIKGSVL